MKIKKRLISISIVIIIFLTIIISFLLENRSKYVVSYNNYKMNNIDESIVSKVDMHKLLKRCNYNSRTMTCFNSIPLLSNSNIYQLYWMSKIIETIDPDKKTPYFTNDIITKDILGNYSNLELDRERIKASVTKYIAGSPFDKNEIIKTLMEHYDEKSRLFFWISQHESEKEKISATCVTLETLKALNMLDEISIVKDVKRKLIDLYCDDTYYTKQNINDNIINNGGVIITSLKLLGLDINSDNLPKDLFEKRLEWVNNLNKYVSSNYQYDLFSLLNFKQTIEINDFFKLDFNMPINYWDEFFKIQNSFYGFGYEIIGGNKEVFNIESHILYIVIDLCKRSNYTFPYEKELNSYIDQAISAKFTNYSDIKFYPKENYYGMLLADKYEFEYDKKKMENAVNDYYTRFFEEDSSIKDSDKLNEIYYLILSYIHMKKDIPNAEAFAKSIEEYLIGIPSDQLEGIHRTISSYKTGLSALNLLNAKLSNDSKTKMKETLEKAKNYKPIINSIYITELRDVAILLGDDMDFKKGLFRDNILNTINQLATDGGYKYNSAPGGEPDIESTYKSIKAKSELVGLDNKDKESIKQFLISLKSKEGVFRMSKSGSYADLRVIYYALKTTTYYQ